MKNDGTRLQRKAEDELLAKLQIKCKECDARMSTGRQEGKRFYLCTNHEAHKDYLDRYVWVEMPKYLDLEGEFDTELSGEKETN
jgi:hypothetical protein